MIYSSASASLWADQVSARKKMKNLRKPKPGSRIVVAMSGGVDSCVTAALLQEQGYEVIGITMQLWNHGSDADERFDSCCSLTDVHDARKSAHKLGIPHYVVNYEKEFKKGVVDYFASEYAEGRTPNPCVMCNSKLKFDHLVERAKALGSEWVATGHYARLIHGEDGSVELLKGRDPNKDQSYFLFDMKQEYLSAALFPLGDYTKPEVRAMGEKMGMHTHAKKESQEICFVTGNRYSDFLEKHYPEVTTKSGLIVDLEGKILGEHEGIHLFTVGQRKGLGHLGNTDPLYVKDIDGDTNKVTVGSMDDLSVADFYVSSINWLVPEEEVGPDKLMQVMVRYRAKVVPCRVRKTANGTYDVLLEQKARWVTPGQAAVFYDGDKVLGGGFIAKRAEATIGASVQKTMGASQPHI
jgi:tRNA-uridine 2-sulfurtransferase